MKKTHYFFAFVCLAGLVCVLTGCPVNQTVGCRWEVAVFAEDSIEISYPPYVNVGIQHLENDTLQRYTDEGPFSTAGCLSIIGEYWYWVALSQHSENYEYKDLTQKVRIKRLTKNAPVKILVVPYPSAKYLSNFRWLPSDINKHDSVFEEMVYWYGEQSVVVLPTDEEETEVTVYER